MAVDIKDLTMTAQDKMFGVMKLSQGYVLEAVKTITDTVEKYAPDMPMPSIPGVDKLPSPADAVTMGFDFAGTMMANQKAFALSLIDAMTPKAKAA